jgi:hypothetical protein
MSHHHHFVMALTRKPVIPHQHDLFLQIILLNSQTGSVVLRLRDGYGLILYSYRENNPFSLVVTRENNRWLIFRYMIYNRRVDYHSSQFSLLYTRGLQKWVNYYSFLFSCHFNVPQWEGFRRLDRPPPGGQTLKKVCMQREAVFWIPTANCSR